MNPVAINKIKQLAWPFLVGIIFFSIYVLTSPGSTDYNYFSRLATSFSQGRLYLLENPSWLNELIPQNGHYYVVYPPMPAVLMVPLAWVLRADPPETLFTIALAVVTLGLVYKLLRRLDISKPTAILATVLLGYGTDYWYLASVGSAWYLSHIVGIFFLTLALLEAFGKKRWFLIGLLVGAAYWSRTTMIFSIVFFYSYFRKSLWPVKKTNWSNWFWLHWGVLLFIVLDSSYNMARFGNFSPLAPYTLIPNIQNDPIFNQGFIGLKFIPRQLQAAFWSFPHFSNVWPFVIPSLYSLSIWLNSPALILTFKAKLDNLIVSSWSAILATLGVIFLWAGVGYAQFGYRFIQDASLFLIIIFARVYRYKPSWLAYLLVGLSILVNAWGVILINKLGLATI